MIPETLRVEQEKLWHIIRKIKNTTMYELQCIICLLQIESFDPMIYSGYKIMFTNF